MSSDLPVVAPVSELSHKTVIIYLCVFLLVVGGIGAALYFLVFKKKSCKTDSDCSTGEICNDGKCYKIDPSTKCKSDGDCGNNQVCDSGKCVTKPSQKQCTKDGDCGNGMICDIKSGKCVTKPSQKQCTKIEDCGNAQCINNKCVFANFIVAFDTADLPDGWVECDGNNGTPDIQGKFIKGCDEKDLDFGKLGGAGDNYSSHVLTRAETYHEHDIPRQALSTNAAPSTSTSCFFDYNSMINNKKYDGTNSYPQYTVNTIYKDTPTTQTPIDLTPKCTSVIFATPSLVNATNFFPVGSIIWLYNNTQAPSLSNSDWTYYTKGSDGFFIGRKDKTNPGDTFGNNTITLTSSNIPSHVHLFYYPLYPDFENGCANNSDNNRSCPDGNIFRNDEPFADNMKKTSYNTNNNKTSGSTINILPKYQTLFCIQKTNSNINDIPIGSICAWNSTLIPEGWEICNGKKNTPDLTSKFILNETKENTLKQGGNSSIKLKDYIPEHYHTYNFVQYRCDSTVTVNNCYYYSNGLPISDCSSGQDSDMFPIVAMCDNDGSANDNAGNNNCIFDDDNQNNVSWSIKQPDKLPPPRAPYSINPKISATSLILDPPHIKLNYIMKTN